jgi:hypothetical protein
LQPCTPPGALLCARRRGSTPALGPDRHSCHICDGDGATSPPPTSTEIYRDINDTEKLFDDKAASDSNYGYSAGDKDNDEKWRRTIRGFFVSRGPVLAPILDFIEHEDNVGGVTLDMAEEACRVQGWMVEDLERLNGAF